MAEHYTPDSGQLTIELEEINPKEHQLRDVANVAGLVDEDKIRIWLEGGNDLDEEDKAILDKFLPRTGDIHCMWKEIINGDLDSVKEWIGRVTKEEIDECDSYNGLNALHYSIIFKKTELVEVLLKSGAAHDHPSSSGLLPFHFTILGQTPFTEAIKLLLSHQAEDINKPATREGPPLYLAMVLDKLEAVTVLLEHGADPNFCWEYKMILEWAIEQQNRSMVKAMLEIPSSERICLERLEAKSCTRTYTATEITKDTIIDNHLHTPFSGLITEFPDIAEVVLNKCITTTNAPHKEDYEIEFDCSLFENENSSANKCYRGLPCIGAYDIYRQLMYRDKIYIGDSFEKHRHPLYRVLMLNHNARLLKHPLILTLLEWKLKKFGWPLYIINLAVYVILVGLLTCFILLIPNPQSYKCLKLTNSSNTSQQEVCEAVGLEGRTTSITILRILILLFVILRILVELYQLYSKKVIGYVRDWVNWVEMAQNIASIIFVSGVDRQSCFCPSQSGWEAGIVSIALTWVVLVVWVQTMPLIGIYVIIMLRIIRSFLKVAIFGILLVVGFGLSFYLLFYQPPPEGAPDTPATYSYPLRAILAIIPFTAGDIGIDGVFYTNTEAGSPIGREYETLAFIIWICALIIMSILFNNLLVGLAIGEVNDIIEEAQITTIKQKIDLILTLEENIPECIHQRVIVKRPIIVQPRKVEDIITHCKCFLNASCLMCSAIFCNINHVLYWLYKYEQPDKKEPSKLYYDIPGLNKQIKLHKVESGPPVTKEEVQVVVKEVVQAVIKEEVQALKEAVKEEVQAIANNKGTRCLII